MATISTATQIKSAKAGLHKVAGATCLYLRKTSDGSNSGAWVFRYRLGGARHQMGLGSIGVLSLAQARKRVVELGGQRNAGSDPIGARKRERADILARDRAEAKQVTFAQAAGSFLKAHGPSWKGRYARAQWWNPVRDYALPVIGDLFLDDIRVEHVVTVMRKAEKAGAKETARRVRARIGRAWAA
jgi:hypothetical protein